MPPKVIHETGLNHPRPGAVIVNFDGLRVRHMRRGTWRRGNYEGNNKGRGIALRPDISRAVRKPLRPEFGPFIEPTLDFALREAKSRIHRSYWHKRDA